MLIRAPSPDWFVLPSENPTLVSALKKKAMNRESDMPQQHQDVLCVDQDMPGKPTARLVLLGLAVETGREEGVDNHLQGFPLP